MQLIYKAFCAASLIGITAAANAQDAQPATTQQTTPDEPGATPPSTNPSSTAQATPGQTQETPGGASQSTPPESGQTTAAKAVPATAADLKAGNSVYDQNGDLVGKIRSVDSKGAVVDTGKVSVDIPLKSIAKGDKGLAIAMTKDEVEAAAKKSPPK
ncbi:MAG TPA: hypothetical protein VGM04_07475 [Sphingomicrobium sp.]